MPFFSNSFTRAASENLAGGFVNFCSSFISFKSRVSPSESGGKISSPSDFIG